MMATLNSSYQYIGRTSGVSCDRGWNYYILLYAKTTGDISTGKHTVGVKMRLVCDRESTFYGYYTDGSVKVNGVSAIFWDGQQVPNATWNTSSITEGGITYPRWIDLKEGTAVVNIGYGAAKDVKVEASWHRNSISSTPPAWLPYTTPISANITVTLPMIATASAITAVGNVTLGNACSVTWTPQAASFRYKLKFSLGDWNYTTGIIHPNKTSAYTYTEYPIPLEAAYQIPNAFTGIMTVTLYTYSDSNATAQIGSADSETFTVTLPASAAPIVSMKLSPVHSLPAAFNGIYVQGVSKVRAELSATLQYGARIKFYDMTTEGNTYGANEDYTSRYITGSGTVSIVGQAMDSRDYGGYLVQTINVIPYAQPKLQNVMVGRCDANGVLDDAGTYLKIKATRNYSPVVANGEQRNFCEIKFRYSDGATYTPWVTVLSRDSLGSNEVTTGPLLGGALSVQESYTVHLMAIDDVGRYAEAYILIPTDKVFWHRDGARNALGLGKYNERDDAIDSAWDFYMNGNKITGLPMPVDDTDAVPKAYVAPADVKISKNLNTQGWYKVGTIAGEMCAVVTLTIGGMFMNNQTSSSMVDIATHYQNARTFLRIPSVASNQISQICIVMESPTVYGIYAYYNSTTENPIMINVHTHMGVFTEAGLAASSVSTSDMVTMTYLKE